MQSVTIEEGRNIHGLVIPYVSGKTVLDLGCIGHHWTTFVKNDFALYKVMKPYAKSVLGLDYLEKDVEKLSSLGYNIKYGNVENFDLGVKFDVIVAAELIEHLENFRGFLESCKKHMTRNSKLIITTPNLYSLASFAMNLVNKPYSNPDHTCMFDEVTLKQLLSRHQLKIETIRYLYARQHGLRGAFFWVLDKLPRSAPGLFVVASKQSVNDECGNCVFYDGEDDRCLRDHKLGLACGDFKHGKK